LALVNVWVKGHLVLKLLSAHTQRANRSTWTTETVSNRLLHTCLQLFPSKPTRLKHKTYPQLFIRNFITVRSWKLTCSSHHVLPVHVHSSTVWAVLTAGTWKRSNLYDRIITKHARFIAYFQCIRQVARVSATRFTPLGSSAVILAMATSQRQCQYHVNHTS